MRIGQGFDIHKLIDKEEFESKFPQRKAKLILAGLEIEHSKILEGHSDADVLVHAIIDAMFGAAKLGDIGEHFPNTDPQYSGISSMKLLVFAKKLLDRENYQIINLDTNIMAEKPRLRPYIKEMESNLAAILGTNAINIKVGTTEGLGFVGREEGIAASATILIQKI